MINPDERAKVLGETFEWQPPYEDGSERAVRIAHTTLGQAAVFLSESQRDALGSLGGDAPVSLMWDSQAAQALAFSQEEMSAFTAGCLNHEFDFDSFSDESPATDGRTS